MNTRNLDDQVESTENGAIEVADKSQDAAATSATSQTELNAEKLGLVYFIRHGESTSNERNIFAGVLDVELTSFGRLQARQAGVDLKKKGTKFDAVYVSHMRRARQTCEIALASPVLSVLWGGNLDPSAVLSRTLSIVAPLALLATLRLPI
jgi:Fructose-2,6-bisphosphatase